MGEISAAKAIMRCNSFLVQLSDIETKVAALRDDIENFITAAERQRNSSDSAKPRPAP